jgi:hypothetical protein
MHFIASANMRQSCREALQQTTVVLRPGWFFVVFSGSGAAADKTRCLDACLINTQLQLGVWCAEGLFNRFSGFLRRPLGLASTCARARRRKTVETVDSQANQHTPN